MEKIAKRNFIYFLLPYPPLILYPLLLLSLILLIFLFTALIFKYERGNSTTFLSLLGIEKTKDFLFFLLVIICALFVLLVLTFSLGFLPSAPPLPA
ncbi:hypothetical protein H5T88_01440 [bacterium]|nr:hypothetical protein [bacterium]